MIQYALQPSQPLPTPPGSERVKMVSKTQLLMALDYTDQINPKLITLPNTEMKKKLIAIKKGEDLKMKPIINVRIYPTKLSVDNTALYFRVNQNYHFLYVDESKLHLEIKTIVCQLNQTPDYIMYTSFAPTAIHSSAALLKRKGLDITDGQLDDEAEAEVTEQKAPSSPTMGDDQGAAIGAVPSPVLKLKKTGSDSTTSDSGIDTRSPESNEEGKVLQNN